MIVVVGVGHVFAISEQVRDIIHREKPDAVCVELDQDRYSALLRPSGRSSAHAAYRLLAAFQRRLAKQYGGEVGSEMLTATRAAQEMGAKVLLIDVNAAAMFRRLWMDMPFKEKMLLAASAFTSVFLSKETVEKELEAFQENEKQYLESLENQFPTLKHVLIDERNETMAKRILAAAEHYPTVLAVVGDGHVEGIVRLLNRTDVKVYRLREIRDLEGKAKREPNNGNAEVSISYEYTQ